MSYQDTLNALVSASATATKAENKCNESATAHAPHAILAILSGEKSLEAWIIDACDAASVKSGKGKKNAAALREGGYGGLYNMAVALKWFDDNRQDSEGDETLIVSIAYDFCRVDVSGNLARDYMIASKAMLPAEARVTDTDTVKALYEQAEGDKESHAMAYWKAIEAPATFAAFMKDCKAAMAAPKGDAFTNAIDKVIATLGKLELAELQERQAKLAELLAAIGGASKRLEESAATDSEGEAELLKVA